MVNEIYKSQYLAAQIEASLGKTPIVNYSTRTWMLWDIETSQYVDSGVLVDSSILIDPTLAISGAAADAATVKRLTRFAPGLDYLAIGARSNGSSAGITFSWDESRSACTVSGTVSGGTSAKNYFAGATTAIPAGIVPGRTYRVRVKTTDTNAYLGFLYFKNGVYFSSSTFRADTEVIIPEGIDGLHAAICVAPGATVSGARVYDIALTDIGDSEGIPRRLGRVETMVAQMGQYAPAFENRTIATWAADPVYAPNPTRLTTDVLSFDNKFLRVGVDDGYAATFLFVGPTGDYIWRSVSAGVHYLYAGKNMPVAISLRRADGAEAISQAEAVHIHISDVDDAAKDAIGGGISRHKIEWEHLAYVNGRDDQGVEEKYLYYANSVNKCVSQPIKLPRSGLRIGYLDEAHSEDNITVSDDSFIFDFPSVSVVVFRAGDTGLALQRDNADLLAVSKSQTCLKHSVYVPFVEDCYAVVVAEEREDINDLIYVSSGEVERSYCGVYNIFPTALRVIRNRAGFENTNALDIFGRESMPYSQSSAMYYATIVRLQDVRRVSCSPKYTLLAEVYKANKDGMIERYGDAWGTWFGSTSSNVDSQVTANGLPCIDFDGYDFDGFALIAIQATAVYVESSDPWGYNVRRLTTGGLGGYEGVRNGVFVEYKNGVRVEETPGMPAIIAENIHKLCNWRVPVYGSGFYVEQAHTDPYFLPTQYNAVISVYNGTFSANTLLMNVTAKSALTCVQNRNGRLRKMQRIQASQGEPTKGNIGYGITCTNLASIVQGLKENYAPSACVWGENKKFTRYDFDYATDLDKLRPGDILTRYIFKAEFGRNVDSHCMVVSSIVSVNGVVKAVNVIEGAAPYCRFAAFIDESYYAAMSDDNWIATTHSIHKLAVYKWINRIKPQYLQPLEKVFDLYPEDTTVGAVMCDRGTDSIYGVHTPYIELSFRDGDVGTYLYVYRQAASASNPWTFGEPELFVTIPKTHATDVNGLKLANMVSYLPAAGKTLEAGLYTVKLAENGPVQERFYVQSNVPKLYYHDDPDAGKTTLYIPNYAELSWIEVLYYECPDLYRQNRTHVKADPDDPTPPAVDVVPIATTMTVTVDNGATGTETITITQDMGYGMIEIPMWETCPGYDGPIYISGINRIYDTPYGTYIAKINGWVTADYPGVDL